MNPRSIPAEQAAIGGISQPHDLVDAVTHGVAQCDQIYLFRAEIYSDPIKDIPCRAEAGLVPGEGPAAALRSGKSDGRGTVIYSYEHEIISACCQRVYVFWLGLFKHIRWSGINIEKCMAMMIVLRENASDRLYPGTVSLKFIS
jgi:hypothetical protein